jgi:hypothetical protein
VELQEQLLDREEELTRREEALVVPEVDIEASKRALGGGGCIEHGAEWARTEATRQEYIDKLHANSTRMKHTLDFDRMLEEKKVLLVEQKQDLKVRGVALVEA